jgi:amidase
MPPKPPAVSAILDATGEAELVATGKMTPLELVEAAIARIEAVNPQLDFMAAKAFDLARTRAKAGALSGPFAGVPFLIKDLLEYPGVPFRRGSRLFANDIGKEKPPLVEAHEAAGLIVVGKSTTPEFGLTASTEPIVTGITRNPWNPGHTPGGSSGGAAAAVACGALPFSHASDGGGSIRIPASCCGLFGLKPSRGRQVSSGQPEEPLELSAHHCLSRSVRDSARLLSLTERRDSAAPLPATGFVSGPAKERLKIALSTRRLDGAPAAPGAKASAEAGAALCRSLGHTVVEQDLPLDGAAFTQAFMLLWAAGAYEVADVVRKATGKWPGDDLLEPWTLGLADMFRKQPADALPKTLGFLQTVAAEIDAFLATVDVILTPVVDIPPPEIGYLDPRLPFETHFAHVTSFVAYTPIHNVAGTPAMSVPLYWTKTGLPMGTQFAARMGRESTLLELAYELEAAQPWVGRRPPVFAMA